MTIMTTITKIEEYKNIMKEVLIDLWKMVWLYWRDCLNTPMERLVMDYLFKGWGILEDYLDFSCEWFKDNYFPDNFTIIIFNDKFGKIVKVNNGKDCIFEGIILNEEEQKEKVWSENENIVDSIDVHWDIEEGLYLWQHLQ